MTGLGWRAPVPEREAASRWQHPGAELLFRRGAPGVTDPGPPEGRFAGRLLGKGMAVGRGTAEERGQGRGRARRNSGSSGGARPPVDGGRSSGLGGAAPARGVAAATRPGVAAAREGSGGQLPAPASSRQSQPRGALPHQPAPPTAAALPEPRRAVSPGRGRSRQPVAPASHESPRGGRLTAFSPSAPPRCSRVAPTRAARWRVEAEGHQSEAPEPWGSLSQKDLTIRTSLHRSTPARGRDSAPSQEPSAVAPEPRGPSETSRAP